MFGRVVKGKWTPITGFRMHTIFYRECKDVNAVIHTHTPYASVFNITHEKDSPGIDRGCFVVNRSCPLWLSIAPGFRKTRANCAGYHTLWCGGSSGKPRIFDSRFQPGRSLKFHGKTARLVIRARSMDSRVITLNPEIQAQVHHSYLTDFTLLPSSNSTY